MSLEPIAKQPDLLREFFSFQAVVFLLERFLERGWFVGGFTVRRCSGDVVAG
jgi:hypothetical protein